LVRGGGTRPPWFVASIPSPQPPMLLLTRAAFGVGFVGRAVIESSGDS